jgi:L-alanine-DL-glutamate epimerase-like enolase superfamily enzyme
MNPHPDYSAAYVTVRTSSGDEGYGSVFTIGRRTEVAVAAIRAVERLVVGLPVDDVLADLGRFWRRLTHDNPLRWLGPEKGVVHMAIGAVVNAVWDLAARRAGKPLWQLLAELRPREIVELVDFRHLTDVLTPDEALDLHSRAEPAKAERVQRLRAEGYAAYRTSAGWLGYPDDVLGYRRIAEAVAPVRVATGEHVANRVLFKQLLSSGAIAVCQLDACRVAGVNDNIAILLLAAKYGVPVSPHAGGVGLCEVVQHLSMFDYVAVSGTAEGRWIEYVDHLHEHFVDPVHVRDGRYVAPEAPGSGAALRPEALLRFEYPYGSVWDAGRDLEERS